MHWAYCQSGVYDRTAEYSFSFTLHNGNVQEKVFELHYEIQLQGKAMREETAI